MLLGLCRLIRRLGEYDGLDGSDRAIHRMRGKDFLPSLRYWQLNEDDDIDMDGRGYHDFVGDMKI